MKKFLLLLALGAWALACSRSSIPAAEKEEEILHADTHLPIVKAHCTGCHSPKLISMNRFTREGWLEKIRWMQETQKLWDLGESESVVLDYLEKYYSPETKTGRRAALENVKWYNLDEKN